MQTLRALTLAPLVLAVPAVPVGAQAELTRAGGVVGGTLDYALQGGPGQLFGLALSTTTGPTPLAIFDPGDPRLLSVGVDLVKLWQLGALDGAGSAALSLPVPDQPALQGLPIHAQMITLPGATTLVDAISARNSVRLGETSSSVPTPFFLDVVLNGHTATPLATGDALLAGGVVDDGLATAAYRLYDHQAGHFVTLEASMGAARTQHTATRLADGRVLTLGGSNDAGLVHASGEILDPATMASTPIPSMSVPRVGHTATLLPDGRVLVAGGTASFDFSDPLGALGAVHQSTAIFDPQVGTWAPGPNLPKKRALHAATLTGDGRVLITGGIEITTIFFLDIPDFSNDARRFDPSTGAMLATPAFNGPRAMHGQILLSNGDVLLGGGVDGDLLTQVFDPLASTRVYLTASNAWASGASMGVARVMPGYHQVGSEVVAIGGLSTFDLVAGTGSGADEIEVGPLSAASWTQVATTVLPRFFAVVAPVGPGQFGERVLVTGSGDDGTGGPDVTAETFLP